MQNLMIIHSAVKTEHSGEIEEEIVEKLDSELNKKFPSICESFKPRVTPINKKIPRYRDLDISYLFFLILKCGFIFKKSLIRIKKVIKV